MKRICLLLEHDWLVDNPESSENIFLTWCIYKAAQLGMHITLLIAFLLCYLNIYTISNICLKVIANIYCPYRSIISIMLSQNLCQVCKCLFLHNLKLNSINVASLARRIHSSSKRFSESEEQPVQKCETEELPQNTENSNSGRLHIPVMVEEVVTCLSPQPGQVSEMIN